MNRIVGLTFFQTLPKRAKVILHTLEMLLMLYVTTALFLLGTPLGVHLTEYLPTVAISFLALYPPIHLLVEMIKGVPGTSPDEAKTTQTTPTHASQP